MNEPNLLNHIEYRLTDASNVWSSDGITDIPVYTPNSISLDEGIKVYGAKEEYAYMLHHDDTVSLLYGLDPKGRYVFLDLKVDSTTVNYKFGGRAFPQFRRYPCIRVLGRKLYLSGGILNGDPVDDIWVYDIDENIWTYLGELPSPRWSHSMLVTDDTIYVFGGSTKSKIDGKVLVINDLMTNNASLSGSWSLWDEAAYLPHSIGNVIGHIGNSIYLIIDGYMWTANQEVAIQQPGLYSDLVHISDVRLYNGTTLIRNNEGTIYRWSGPTEFDVILEGVLCIPESDTDEIRLSGPNILVNGTIVGADPPPTDKDYRTCRHNGLMAYMFNRSLYLCDMSTLHTSSVYIAAVPNNSYIASHGEYIYIIGWTNDAMMYGRYSTSSGYEPLGTSDMIEYRTKPAITCVQDTIWIIGGLSKSSGFIKDQWKLDINTMEWSREILLNALPPQPFLAFGWRDRLWIVPHQVELLYRYYPSQKQWTSVSINVPGSDEPDLGIIEYNNSWAVVDDMLFIEPKGAKKTRIDLESMTAYESDYKGVLSFAVDRAHILNIDGRMFMADGAQMAPIISDQPPHFSNHGYEKSIKGKDIAEKWGFTIVGRNHYGEQLPAYLDDNGVFWCDNVNARLTDPDNEDGFYIPSTDYNGLLGLNRRRIPSITFTPRDNSLTKSNYGYFDYSDGKFIVSAGHIIRYRTEDGSHFSYNAPVSKGAAFGVSESGLVYIFGGHRGSSIKPLLQTGIDDDIHGATASHQTFVVYDMGYANGELEYIATEPDFYERQDFEVAADYLVSRLKQSIPLGDDVTLAMAESLKENFYRSTQAIIDDIAVRYITYENGTRPSCRSYPYFAQVGQKLYIGGGGSAEVDPYTRIVTYQAIDGFTGAECDTFHVFDMDTKTWSELSPLGVPILVAATSAPSPDGKDIYVIGGYTSSGLSTLSDSVYVYNIESDKWSELDTPEGYLGRAKPSLLWLDEDHLMVMYGHRCDMSMCGDLPCYWFNSLGDSWIIHRPTGAMYKYSTDLPKTFTIVPDNRDEPYVSILYSPGDQRPGGYSDIVTSLAMARRNSADWGPYSDAYSAELTTICEILNGLYDDRSYISESGSIFRITTKAVDADSIVSIYNAILPDDDSSRILDAYEDSIVDETMLMFSGVPIPVPRINIAGYDLTKQLMIERASEGGDLSVRGLFTALDAITGAPYPANRISYADKLLIRISLLDGRYEVIKKIVTPFSFSVEDVFDFFQYKDGDWWLCVYAAGQLRFLRMSPRLDGDIDLIELMADIPSDSKPLMIGYDGGDNLLCAFDRYNIWQLNLTAAIVNPNANSWAKRPPVPGLKSNLKAGMRSVMIDGKMIFIHADNTVLSYDPINFVWDVIRDKALIKSDYLVVDGAEVYFFGSDPSYFDLTTMQGDRFKINSDICELTNGTSILPRLSVQRNRIFGFDANNNLLASYTRKMGTYNRSWHMDGYYYIERVLISVDYGSLLPDRYEVYIRGEDGVKKCDCYVQYASEPWSYNSFTREYTNGAATTQVPDQYIVAIIGQRVSEVQVIFTPPINNYGYTAHVNDIKLVPAIRSGVTLSARNYFLSCRDEVEIGINNLADTVTHISCTSDSGDLLTTWTKDRWSQSNTRSLPQQSNTRLQMKCLSPGKTVHVMVIEDTN